MPEMPEGTKAFVVRRDGKIVDRIVPSDPKKIHAELLIQFPSPQFTIHCFNDFESPELINPSKEGTPCPI
jgi:hypothetical protein